MGPVLIACCSPSMVCSAPRFGRAIRTPDHAPWPRKNVRLPVQCCHRHESKKSSVGDSLKSQLAIQNNGMPREGRFFKPSALSFFDGPPSGGVTAGAADGCAPRLDKPKRNLWHTPRISAETHIRETASRLGICKTVKSALHRRCNFGGSRFLIRCRMSLGNPFFRKSFLQPAYRFTLSPQ